MDLSHAEYRLLLLLREISNKMKISSCFHDYVYLLRKPGCGCCVTTVCVDGTMFSYAGAAGAP